MNSPLQQLQQQRHNTMQNDPRRTTLVVLFLAVAAWLLISYAESDSSFLRFRPSVACETSAVAPSFANSSATSSLNAGSDVQEIDVDVKVQDTITNHSNELDFAVIGFPKTGGLDIVLRCVSLNLFFQPRSRVFSAHRRNNVSIGSTKSGSWDSDATLRVLSNS